jgi:hypothetical protein
MLTASHTTMAKTTTDLSVYRVVQDNFKGLGILLELEQTYSLSCGFKARVFYESAQVGLWK